MSIAQMLASTDFVDDRIGDQDLPLWNFRTSLFGVQKVQKVNSWL